MGVKGVLMNRRGGYFIKWNNEIADGVWVSEETVNRCLPEKRPGLVAVVTCTIEKLGPSNAHWTKQHPMSKDIEIVTRYWRDDSKFLPKSATAFKACIPMVNCRPTKIPLNFTARVHQKTVNRRPRFINSRKGGCVSMVTRRPIQEF